jgi:hypothetical protein
MALATLARLSTVAESSETLVLGLTVGEFVSLLVALTALLVAAATLWFTALQPGRLSLTYMSEHTRIEAGGLNEIPNACNIRAFIAVSNSGARAALLEHVSFGPHFDVKPSSALMFAVGATPRPGRPPGSMIRLDGSKLSWPRTVEASDVRALELDFALGGSLLRAREEDKPDLAALARLIAELEWVSIGIYATYRTGSGVKFAGYFFRQRREHCTVYIPGAHLRRAAIAYWSEIDRDDLAQIVSDSFTGRDIDKI